MVEFWKEKERKEMRNEVGTMKEVMNEVRRIFGIHSNRVLVLMSGSCFVVTEIETLNRIRFSDRNEMIEKLNRFFSNMMNNRTVSERVFIRAK